MKWVWTFPSLRRPLGPGLEPTSGSCPKVPIMSEMCSEAGEKPVMHSTRLKFKTSLRHDCSLRYKLGVASSHVWGAFGRSWEASTTCGGPSAAPRLEVVLEAEQPGSCKFHYAQISVSAEGHGAHFLGIPRAHCTIIPQSTAGLQEFNDRSACHKKQSKQ